ncbi:glutamyl-tRNA(Gln) amidotransferase subunit B, putative [Plasmodium knowlesi strain H]|uniref:Glutamyl-tRNA(Gln) amidotransferase subunit B, putative n=3 Tax=Plasmodium knowlesi TaxID=5850 RepID=A0A5K1VEB2_PLAKH|nr:glutamyl-tRNA(Gln) amidotransferase subunit B, putative [Plasmodium knowlesi strain H]OTN64515.1 putative Glu-tRNAGln amidotransferase [Plasmodium knowlesi]CAA9989038.1 glutamyl-tRNA(Gln) amidotransferase subunit B, putative [Plasmodium knowlesi strain H]SBO27248.1 glutamyl-tRNA(Gln) amidotransferase subunit B, putative [Plasmodium knowlesi strain H]SBO28879.1 glutamyl-tRNA(Gln) amidotransferase subunit B, putative [Plasmodium knowlesi strain H]VVS78512.1 glutamyl-tRNA(Gln) amidotransferase|eukprot:XP_002261387.1 Glu-tRNAGln amidotransferase, putative [Plasmodium knowlesi strain H]
MQKKEGKQHGWFIYALISTPIYKRIMNVRALFPCILIFISTEIFTCYKLTRLTRPGDFLFHNKGETKRRRGIRIRVAKNRTSVNDGIANYADIERKVKCRIGVEVHVQLSTKYKAFCNCFNVASSHNDKTYERNYIDVCNFLKENILKTGNEGADLNWLGEGTSPKKTQGGIISTETKGSINEDPMCAINRPNKHICNRCVGEVGSLSLLNNTAVLFTYLIGIIFNCRINNIITFDRKIYNYYDLPKGYQITQKETPIGFDGNISVEGKNFRIKSVHLEEDTSKCFFLPRSVHISDNRDNPNESNSHAKENALMDGSSILNLNNDSGEGDKDNGGTNLEWSMRDSDELVSHNYEPKDIPSNGPNEVDHPVHILNEVNHLNKKILLDYNRCGIPLAEIVVEDDYMNAEECINLLKEIRNKVCLLGVCVGSKENIRSDINISFEYDNVKYSRVEIKNVNSFRKIKNCIEQEKKYFINKIIRKGIEKDYHSNTEEMYTKSYLDSTHYVVRKKEVYNYVHERNIPQYKLGKHVIKLLKFYVNYKIKIYEDEVKYNWSKQYFHVFLNDPFLYNYFNECLKYEEEKYVSNFIVNILLDVIKKKNMLSKNIVIKPKNFCFLINYAMKNNLDNTSLKNFLYNYVDVGFENELLLETFKNVNVVEMEQDLKKLIDDNIQHLKIDGEKNVLNEQNFKNRIMGLLKSQMSQRGSQVHINYKSVSAFIDDYVRRLP